MNLYLSVQVDTLFYKTLPERSDTAPIYIMFVQYLKAPAALLLKTLPRVTSCETTLKKATQHKIPPEEVPQVYQWYPPPYVPSIVPSYTIQIYWKYLQVDE